MKSSIVDARARQSRLYAFACAACMAPLVVACSREARPVAPEPAGMPAYWESNVPRDDKSAAPPAVDPRVPESMPVAPLHPDGKGRSDKYLWDRGAGPTPDADDPQAPLRRREGEPRDKGHTDEPSSPEGIF